MLILLHHPQHQHQQLYKRLLPKHVSLLMPPQLIPLLINPPPHSYCSVTLAVSTNDLSCTVVFQKAVYAAEWLFVFC